MPAYFSMTMQFEKKRVHPGFVKEVYSQIISCGFGFKSGYWFHEEATLDEIIDWNQRLLEKGFTLGFTQHVKHDYMQILFTTEHYSEMRGFWIHSSDEVVFHIIVPESSILNCEGGLYFIESKVAPVINLAIKLWESGIVDAIQTSLELDEGCFCLSDALTGKNVSVSPFAVLPEKAFEQFSDGYFSKMNLCKILKNGLFIEDNGTISHDL